MQLFNSINKKMKIWYLCQFASQPGQGKYQRQFLLCRNMAKEGHSLTLFSGRHIASVRTRFWGINKSKMVDGVNCVLVNGTFSKEGINLRRIISMLSFELFLFLSTVFVKKNKRPDVIIASSLSLFTLKTACILKKRFGCKLIVEIRDIWPESPVQAGRLKESNPLVKILRRIEYKGYKNADGIISPIPKFDNYIKKKYPDLKFRFCYISQGFDETLYTGSRIFDKPQGKFNICYAGLIGAANKVDVILDAMTKVKDKNIHLYLIGEGPLKNAYKEKYKEYSNIFFLDAIPKKEMIQFLQNFDLFVMAVRDMPIYDYGISPNKMIDYLIAGKPILNAYNGYRDILEEVNCGKYVEANNPQMLADAMIWFSELDKDQLIQMGRNGQQYVLEKMNFGYLANKLLHFINEVC